MGKLGLKIFHEGEEAVIADIIFVHGLRGHREKSWTKKGVFWPELLSKKLPHARMMTYGYDSDAVRFFAKTGQSSIDSLATQLLEDVQFRRSFPIQRNRPLIWVAHSLGGLIVKNALVISHSTGRQETVLRPEIASIKSATAGVCFAGTPHRGANMAGWAKATAEFANLVLHDANTTVFGAMKGASETLERLQRDFSQMMFDFKICTFLEDHTTWILGKVVENSSAVLGFPHEQVIFIPSGHADLIKFSTAEEVGYERMSSALAGLMSQFGQQPDIGNSIASPTSSWSNASMSRLEQSSGQEFENESTIKSVPQKFEIMSLPMPRNPNFRGRQREISLLQEYFEDAQENGVQVRLAVHGLGGIGKTDLAVEYAYQHLNRNRGAVFWLNGSSKSTMDSDFKRYSNKIESWSERSEEPHYKSDNREITISMKRNSAPQRRNQPGRTTSRYQKGQPRTAQPDTVQVVLDWITRNGDEQTLLIIDNYDDVTFDIRPFLPTCCHCPVIITTRDRRVVGSVAQRGLEVHGMSLSDAEQLLLDLQMGPQDKGPVELHAEYNTIKQIARELQAFPLAISQAAAFVRENAPMTYEEYFCFLQDHWTGDRKLLLKFKEVNPLYPHSIMTTWELSFDYLSQHHPQASFIMQILGHFGSFNIAESMLISATKSVSWRGIANAGQRTLSSGLRKEIRSLDRTVNYRLAIGILSALSLVSRSVDRELGPVLLVHPLVQEWIRIRFDDDLATQTHLSSIVMAILYQSFPIDLCSSNIPVEVAQKKYPMVRHIVTHSHTTSVYVINYGRKLRSSQGLPLECSLLAVVLMVARYYRNGPNELLDTQYGDLLKNLVSLQEDDLLKPFFRVFLFASPLNPDGVMVQCSKSTLSACPKLQSPSSKFPQSHVCRGRYRSSCALEKMPEFASTAFHCIKQQSLQIDEVLLMSLISLFEIVVKHLTSSANKIRFLIAVSDFASLIRIPHYDSTINSELNFRVEHIMATIVASENPVAATYWGLGWRLRYVSDFWTSLVAKLDFERRAQYFTVCVDLLWNFGGENELSRLMQIIHAGWCMMHLECTHQESLNDRWSHFTYISNAFGRSGDFQSTTHLRKTFTKYQGILEKTLPIIEARKNQLQGFLAEQEASPVSSSQNSKNFITKREHLNIMFAKIIGISADHDEIPVDGKFGGSQFLKFVARYFCDLKQWKQASALLSQVLGCSEIVKTWQDRDPKPWDPDYKHDYASYIRSSTPKEDLIGSLVKKGGPREGFLTGKDIWQTGALGLNEPEGLKPISKVYSYLSDTGIIGSNDVTILNDLGTEMGMFVASLEGEGCISDRSIHDLTSQIAHYKRIDGRTNEFNKCLSQLGIRYELGLISLHGKSVRQSTAEGRYYAEMHNPNARTMAGICQLLEPYHEEIENAQSITSSYPGTDEVDIDAGFVLEL